MSRPAPSETTQQQHYATLGDGLQAAFALAESRQLAAQCKFHVDQLHAAL